MSRRAIALVVALGLVLSLGIAVFAAPWASSSPDGLERVAADEGFEDSATAHATADSPAADYPTWAWRALGVVLVFAIAAGLTAVAAGRRHDAEATPGAA